MIPEGWRKAKIRDVAKIDVGRDLVEDRFSRAKTDKHTVPIYSNTVEAEGLYGFYDFPEYTTESVTLVGRGIGLGTAFARRKPFGAIGRLLVLSAKSGSFDVGYLADYFNHRFRLHYESGGIPQLPGKTLGNYSVLLPPYPEQVQISAILQNWDRAIGTVEALIANARAQKQALMQQLLPQGTTPPKKRLPGFSGEWRETTIEGLAKVVMGSSPPSSAYNENQEGLPLIQGNADIHNRRSQPRTHTSEITQICEPDDILFSVRAPVGEISISCHHACIGRGIAAIRPRSKDDFDFLYFRLLAAEPTWARLSQGSTFQAVNSKDLKGFVIMAPSDAYERLEIGQALRDGQLAEDSLQAQLTALRQEKAALMQQLLTGKRRVKLSESEAA